MREPIAPGTWTGPLYLELRNGRDWDPGEMELQVTPQTVHVRHGGRTLAVLDRDRFRDWLLHPMFQFVVDDTRWTCELGVTCVSVGPARFTVIGESLANLVTVI